MQALEAAAGSAPPGLDACLGTPAEVGSPSFSGAVDEAGVPEPAAWALMVLGFGGLGALLRRRRRVLAAA